MKKNSENRPPVKRKSGAGRFLLFLLILILVLGGAAYFYIMHILGSTYVDIPVLSGEETNTAELDAKWSDGGHTRIYYDSKHPILEKEQKDKEVENILVFGIDARGADKVKSRTDSIMVLTVDRRKGKVKLTSIMRDTGVYIGDTDETAGKKLNKVNAAYPWGGVGYMINTINRNFDLDINKFIMFDFSSASKIVDLCDGVEVDIKEKEIPYANKFIKEDNKLNGTNSPEIKKAGKQTLDGIQAVSWARIRYADSDFVRTSRQRTIAKGLMSKVGDMNIFKRLSLLKDGTSIIETNIESTDLLRIALNAMRGAGDVEEYRVPQDNMYTVQQNPWMMKIDFEKQNKELHDFIWEK